MLGPVRPYATEYKQGNPAAGDCNSRGRKPATPIIEACDLVKQYAMGENAVQALGGISLSIDPGEFIAITGPSGSGKSTLMGLLGLIDAPTSGIYRFDGIDISRLGHAAVARLRNTKVGFVFQNCNLLPTLNAQENVELPLVYAGVPRKQRRERVRDLLSSVGLDDRAHHRPCELSGGQQQRVAIARALANRPALILADEPTGALDSRSSAGIMKTLQSLSRQKVTVALVTHDSQIARYANRIVALSDGTIVADYQRSEDVA